MQHCVFLTLFSLGAHGLRVQPSALVSIQKGCPSNDFAYTCEKELTDLREETNTPIYTPCTRLYAPNFYASRTDTIAKKYYISCDENDWKNQQWVHDKVLDFNHNNYGGSARVQKWMYLCAGMTASGDPHVVNIEGEKFDIVSQGEVELIRYPQGSDDSSAKLIITAWIDKLGQGCHDTYMKKIKFSGAWLKEVISFKDDEDTGDILVSQGSDAKLAPMEWHRMNGTDAVKLDSKQIHFATPKRASLTVAGVTQMVVYTAGRVHKGMGTYLNLDLHGFTKLEGKVGGILGLDSHKKEIDLAKDMCRKSPTAKSIALHQKADDVPLHEGGRPFHGAAFVSKGAAFVSKGTAFVSRDIANVCYAFGKHIEQPIETSVGYVSPTGNYLR